MSPIFITVDLRPEVEVDFVSEVPDSVDVMTYIENWSVVTDAFVVDLLSATLSASAVLLSIWNTWIESPSMSIPENCTVTSAFGSISFPSLWNEMSIACISAMSPLAAFSTASLTSLFATALTTIVVPSGRAPSGATTLIFVPFTESSKVWRG